VTQPSTDTPIKMNASQLVREDGDGRVRTRRAFALRRLTASFGFALEGFRYITQTQPNWRIHLAAAAGAVVAGIALQVSPTEMAVLGLAVGLVLALEAVNTAVECTIDSQGGAPSMMAKHAKDASAGAVLVAAGTSLFVAVLIFGPRIVALL
jgi:diacylglycerol kinase